MTSRWLMLPACLVALLVQGMQMQTRTYKVSGVVLSDAGVAEPGARVNPVLVSPEGSVGSTEWVPVNDRAEFEVYLKPGRYLIRAKNEAHGYPDPSFLLTKDDKAKFPMVAVRDSDIGGIRVQMGPPGALLSGRVLDETTGNPIPAATVTIRDARNPSAYVELTANSEGRFAFAVPSKPLVLHAAAHGYAGVDYERGSEFQPSAGETKEITLPMKKDPSGK